MQQNKNYFCKNGIISSDRFHNVVNIGLALNKVEWTKNFIDENTSYVQEIERNDAVALSKANYHFHSNEFDQASTYLSGLKHVTVFYALQGRALELQVYFETKDFENFDKRKLAFRDYLSKNKERVNNGNLTENEKVSFFNFIGFIDDLMKYAFVRDKEKLKKLQSEITDCSLLVYKTWLLKKLILHL